MNPPAVAIRGVSKAFGTHRAVDAVSLDILAGEALVIVGPSGCGKTTLLRLIAGLEIPDTGEIWFGHRQVARPSRHVVPSHERGIGFVFQDLALWPHLTVRQHLDFVVESLRVPRGRRDAMADETMRLARVDHLCSRYPHELSGGEQQRVALARARVGEPTLLLMDEPLSSLDPELRSTLRADLVQLQQRLGITTIYVTHDLEDAGVLAQRTVRMRAGRIESIAAQEKRT